MKNLVFSRFRRWDGRTILAVAEALIFLTAASLAIRLLPFRRVARLAAQWGGGGRLPSASDDAPVRTCCWAVDRWARRVPWKAVCFQQGVAVQMMLHRRRVRSKLHYGLAQSPDTGLKAHVWISVGGQVVLGGRTSEQFVCLATFPPDRSAA